MQNEKSAKLFGDREDPRNRLEELFGDYPAAARAWAASTLEAAGVSTDSHTAAIACLRRAEPRLTLKAATFLVDDLTRV